MATDAMDMGILMEGNKTHQAKYDELHQSMDIKTAKESNNSRFRFQILSVLLSLLIVVLIILLLVFRSNFMLQLHEAEEKIRQLTEINQEIDHTDNTACFNVTAIPEFNNITQEMEAVQNHTVKTVEERFNLDGLLLNQSFNIWKIQGLYDKLLGKTGEILSHVFPVEGYEFPAQVKLKWDEFFDGLWLELSIKFNGSEYMQPIVESPLVAYIFEDQSQSKTKHDLVIVQELYPPLLTQSIYDYNLGYDHMTSLKKVKAERGRYFIDDVTHIKIVVEDPQHVTNSVQSYNGTLSWTMDNFSLRRQMETEKFREYQYSVPFYSGTPGYRMRLIAYTRNSSSGAGFGGGLNFYMRILTGLWDQRLAESNSFRTEITIEDKSSSTIKDHIKIASTSKAGRNWGYFIGSTPQYQIKDGVHLVNDSLSITVVVKTL